MRPDETDRKKRPLLVAFCIPVAIMLAAVAYRGIYPFGDRCFLRVDLYHQYMPFFMELRRKLVEGGSLAFTWNGGLGVNFLALYAYYLASPVNWLLVLCPEEAVIEFMTALIVIKTGLCGLSFAWYLKRHFGADGYETALFAVFYALSGYMAAYQWNIMWLDCIVLAPVILLGLEELLLRRRPLLYCISLACSILSNYYISIFICIYLVFYTGLLLFSAGSFTGAGNGSRLSRWRERAGGLGRFVMYSLLAGGLAGVVWVPGVMALRATRFHEIHFPQTVKAYFDVVEILARHCVNVGTELRNGHWPNIYCGAAVFFLLPLYFLCRKIPWRERCLKLLLLCFFYVSFSVNYVDFLWHGLNFPDSLPARQAFLYILLVLTMCFEAFLHLREAPGGRIVASAVFGLLLLYLCARLGWNEDLSRSSFVFTALYLLTAAFLLVWFFGAGTKMGRRVSAAFLFFLVVAEASMNLSATGVPTVSRSDYRNDYLTNRMLLQTLEEKTERERQPFCRVELRGRMTKNDGMLAGFPTATFFSSTCNADTAYFYRRLGMSTSKVFYSYEGATPLTSALLSAAYTISASPEITDDFHELLSVRQGKYLYRNRHVLPPGFVVPLQLEENWDLDAGNPVEVQNDLVRALGMDQQLFQPVPVVWEKGNVCVEAEENGYYFAYPLSCGTKDIAADRNGYETVYEKVYYPYILNLGWCSRGGRIILSESGNRRSDKTLDIAVYRLDASVLAQALEKLGEQPLEITASADGYVSGIVEAKADGLLVTSIPAESGWRIFVDGKSAAVRPFGGAMLGAALPAGRHTVLFVYRPPGLYAGLAVSISGFVILLMLHVPFPRGTAFPARFPRRRDRGRRSERAAG